MRDFIKPGLLVALISALLATTHGIQNGVALNLASETNFDVAALELGHSCYESSLGANSNYNWITGSGEECLVNTDEALFSITGNPGVNCTASFRNVYQSDPHTGMDIWNAVAIIVGVDVTTLCVNINTTAIGNTSAVTASASCPPCTTSSASPIQAGNFRNVGSVDINVACYIAGTNCYSANVPASGGILEFTAPPGYCTSPLSSITFTAPGAKSCQAVFSETNITNAVAGLLGVVGGNICLSHTIASPGNAISVATTCIPCADFGRKQ